MFPSGELITVIQTSWTEIQAPPSCSIPKIPSQTSRNFILPRTKKKKGKKKKIREIKTNNYQFIFFFPLLPLRARELERERGERERAALRFFTEARELGERERESFELGFLENFVSEAGEKGDQLVFGIGIRSFLLI